MANRLFISTVFSLWLVSMSWLFVEKVLPSLQDGDPPGIAVREFDKPVGWRVEWRGHEVGHAISVRNDGVGGTMELHNRVVLDDIPLMDFAPIWMRHAVGDIGRLRFDARTRMEFDSLGQFSAFESRFSVNDAPSVVRMSGRVDGAALALKVHSGDSDYSTKVHVGSENSLSETLFPDPRLKNLYVNRSWREEVFSPFRPHTHPTEMVEAQVLGEETITIDGEMYRTMRVDYQSASAAGIAQGARLQATSWVDSDGQVVQRDVFLGRSKLRFVRLPDELAAKKAREYFPTLSVLGASGGGLDAMHPNDR